MYTNQKNNNLGKAIAFGIVIGILTAVFIVFNGIETPILSIPLVLIACLAVSIVILILSITSILFIARTQNLDLIDCFFDNLKFLGFFALAAIIIIFFAFLLTTLSIFIIIFLSLIFGFIAAALYILASFIVCVINILYYQCRD